MAKINEIKALLTAEQIASCTTTTSTRTLRIAKMKSK